MKEEKKVNSKKTVKKSSASKGTNVKKTSSTKKNTSKAVENKKNETKAKSTKAVSKSTKKVNLEPKETKVQKNVEFPENKFSHVELDNSKKIEKTIIFTKNEKENIEEVVKELKQEKKSEPKEKKIVGNVNKMNAIKIISVLMVVIVCFTIGYVIKLQNENKLEQKQRENLDKNSTLNSNIYDKIVQNSKDRDDKIGTTKPADNEDNNNQPEIEYSNIKTITLDEFEGKILLHESMTVLISSTTCYYCITYEPIVNEELNNQEKNVYRLNISTMDTEEIKTLKSYYGFTKTPTLFHVREDGVVDEELVGTRGIEELSEWLKNK